MRNLDSKSICLDSFVTNSDSTVPLGRLFDSIDPLLTSPELSSVMGEEQNLGSLSQVRKDTEAGCCALVIEINEEVVRNERYRFCLDEHPEVDRMILTEMEAGREHRRPTKEERANKDSF